MQIQELADYTAQILLDYYENRIQPFLDACDEDVLWIGPAVGQVIRTKKALVAAFAAEKHELRFAVHNLTATLLPTGSSHVMNILLSFLVDTFWPDGSSGRVYQRIVFTWVFHNNTPYIRLCHISNAIAYDKRDRIYPVHYEETYRDQLFHTKIGVKLCSMAGGGVSRNLWNFFRTAPAGTGQAVTCSTSGMGLRLK